jgi:hypothetical protein
MLGVAGWFFGVGGPEPEQNRWAEKKKHADWHHENPPKVRDFHKDTVELI